MFAIIEVERGKFRGVENTAAELDCAPAAGSAGVCGKEKWRENKWIEERKKKLNLRRSYFVALFDNFCDAFDFLMMKPINNREWRTKNSMHFQKVVEFSIIFKKVT